MQAIMPEEYLIILTGEKKNIKVRKKTVKMRKLKHGTSLLLLAAVFLTHGCEFQDPDTKILSEKNYFKDADGGIRIFRGVNMAGDSKVPDFRPVDGPYHFDRLRAFGFNVVRLLFTWEAFQPTPGGYDMSYLEYYTQLVEWAWERGIYVIVDVHQDTFSRYNNGGCGEGFPVWTLPPDLVLNEPNN